MSVESTAPVASVAGMNRIDRCNACPTIDAVDELGRCLGCALVASFAVPPAPRTVPPRCLMCLRLGRRCSTCAARARPSLEARLRRSVSILEAAK